MHLKEHGAEKLGRLIDQNVAQARHLAGAGRTRRPELELMAPVPLNIVCFRYRAPDLDEAELDALNQEMLHPAAGERRGGALVHPGAAAGTPCARPSPTTAAAARISTP